MWSQSLVARLNHPNSVHLPACLSVYVSVSLSVYVSVFCPRDKCIECEENDVTFLRLEGKNIPVLSCSNVGYRCFNAYKVTGMSKTTTGGASMTASWK